MAPKSLRGRRRAKNLALPFVVTAAAACTVKSGPAAGPTTKQAPANSGRPNIKGDAPGNQGTAADPQKGDDVTTISNPPPPEPTPTIMKNPPPPKALEPAPTSGGSMFVTDDGACMWVEDVSCPKDATCNPPPPREVQCPAGGEK